MEIVINNDSFFQSGRGNITSEIYFRFNDFYFPEKKWSDFTIVLLHSWSVSSGMQMLFMDGDFSVRGRLLIDNNIELHFFSGSSEVKEITVSWSNLKNEIKRAAHQAVTHCDNLGFVSEDLESLRYYI